MAILNSLGVDSTIWLHLLCFIVSWLAISQLILKPYMQALTEREKRTVGSEETATRLVEEANALYSAYEQRARAINSEIKGLYDDSRTAAMKDYDRLVESARGEASALLEGARSKISSEIQTARKTLSSDTPAVASAIASKLAGKEISL